MIRAERITETSWQDLVRAVRSYVGRRVPNPEDRDDLVQDVMLRIHRGPDTLKAQDKPGPWIYGIARNVVIDHWRKKRLAPLPIDDAEAALGALAESAEDGDAVQQAVADYLAAAVERLGSPYRETLTFTELQDMKYADAAAALGVSLAAVKSRVQRGREMLRKALSDCCAAELGPTGRVVDCTPRTPHGCSCDTAAGN